MEIQRVPNFGEDPKSAFESPLFQGEDRAQPFVIRFWLTLAGVLIHPRRFFRTLPGGDLISSIAFALIVFVPVSAIHAAAAYLLRSTTLLPDFLRIDPPELLFLAIPLTAVLFVAYLSTFYQAITGIASKSWPPFTTTIRATCFGLAPMVLALVVPLVGLVIGLAWTCVLHAIALRELHGVGRVRAILAVTMPLMVIGLRIVYR